MNTTPKKPINFSAIRREQSTILKWDAVTEDIDGNPVNIGKYRIYRAAKSNGVDFALHYTVDTIDADGKVDVSFFDLIDTDTNLDIRYYKLTAVNLLNEESEFSDEKTGFHFEDIEDRDFNSTLQIVPDFDSGEFDAAVFV